MSRMHMKLCTFVTKCINQVFQGIEENMHKQLAITKFVPVKNRRQIKISTLTYEYAHKFYMQPHIVLERIQKTYIVSLDTIFVIVIICIKSNPNLV